jgi:hypothetical protein
MTKLPFRVDAESSIIPPPGDVPARSSLVVAIPLPFTGSSNYKEARVADKSSAGGNGKRETLISLKFSPRQSAANMNTSSSLPQRRIFGRLSIIAGNMLQIAGIVAAFGALALARSHSQSDAVAAIMMIAAWILFYFFCHGIAHWAVGRLLGIRFAFYTIGGTGNPEGYPAGMRWVFEHLPFFGVQTTRPRCRKPVRWPRPSCGRQE